MYHCARDHLATASDTQLVAQRLLQPGVFSKSLCPPYVDGLI